ncbi:MAG: hypothetical protein HDR88_14445 [Bacteroides sp.]|nr:hypothetical protein [Bacteroides sp.]
MKSVIFIIVFSLLATLGLTSCNPESDCLSAWPHLSKEADRITQALEKKYAEGNDSTLVAAYIDTLRQLADKGDERLKARSLYWKGRREERMGKIDSARKSLEEALEYSDTLNNQYDYRRIRIILDRLNGLTPIKRYSRLIDDERFFRDSKDILMQANVAQQLGNIFITTLQFTDALHYLLKCDSLLEKSGLHIYRMKNRINTAIAYFHCEDSVKADSTLRPLLNNSEVMSDPLTYNIVLQNMHVITRDRKYLLEALRLLPKSTNFSQTEATYAAILSEDYAQEGLIDSANLFASFAFNHINLIHDYNWKAMALRSYGRKLRSENKPDSLVILQDMYISTLDSLQRYRHTSELSRLENERGMTGVREAMQLKHQKQKNNFLWVIIIIIVIAAIAMSILMKRNHQQKLKHLEFQLQTEKDRRKLLALTMMIEEKEGFISNLRQEITRLKESHPCQEANRLEAIIKANESEKITREYFFGAFEQLNPAFIPNLKQRCPDLPESLLQLACLIVTGIDNRHIAEILNIRAASVNQARWRLRTRLSIDKEMSLEEELRKLI